MIKKAVIGVCVLFVAAALSSFAFADQSTGYREYFTQGVQAFNAHDDQKALRCFKIAEIYDPSNTDLKNYLYILSKRGVVLAQPEGSASSDDSVAYQYYLKAGIQAMTEHDTQSAIHYFTIAIIFDPQSEEADQYLRSLSTPVPMSNNPPVSQPAVAMLVNQTSLFTNEAISGPQGLTAQANPVAPVVGSGVSSTSVVAPSVVAPSVVTPAVVTPAVVTPAVVAPAVVAAPAVAVPSVTEQTSQPSEHAGPAAPKAPAAVYTVAQQGPKQAPAVLSLDQILSSGNAKPTLSIDLNSIVIIEGRNIQRFLVVDEGFVDVTIKDTDHLQIIAKSIGTTFLHIWDNSGRHTFYVQVVFPKIVNAGSQAQMNGIQHGRPFIVTYTNDWNTYYSGKNLPNLKRQSYELDQSISLVGDTPYGAFDTSGSYTDDGSVSEFDTYTIGLSQIPLEGTSNFNLRGFDALRYLSPLTMTSTRLRGAFADVDLFNDNLGLSFSHGQEQQPLGFMLFGGPQFLNTEIDALKLTLFPKSQTDQLSFNYATANGSDNPSYLSQHVYSVQGMHKFNDFLTLSAEEGNDTNHDSTLASLNWADGNFKSGLNFRNIDKDYTTITSQPSNQGETGATWTTDTEYKNVSATSFLEAYQDHLYPNPNDPRALNYDGNGHVRVNVTPSVWTDSDANYVDTAGEASPSRSLGLNQRISKSFGVWNSMKGTVFSGVGYQNSHSSGSSASDFGLEDVLAGFSVPLTRHWSFNTTYQYDWLNQPAYGDSNPSIIDTGLEYQKQLSPHLSFTSQVTYHDELGVQSGTSGVLSGEESVILSSGFNYNPTPNLNFFGDCNASKVLSHVGNPSFDDLEFHVGMRLTFGGAAYWDPLGTISGIVFKDRNGDGKFGPGDEGVAGVKVKVGDKVATTDKQGRYRIQIRGKGVDVAPVADTIPGGLLFSTPETLNVPVIQGRVTKADFGLIVQTGIYGIVFLDKDGSGVPNENDKFVGKVKVTLDGKVTQTSDSHGAFYFRNITPGKHVIAININTIALDMLPKLKLMNTIDVPEGSNYMFNIPLQVKKAEGEES